MQTEQGKFDQAAEALARVVTIIEGVREPRAAESKIALAGICDQKGEYQEAERLGLEAIAQLERFRAGSEFAMGLAWKSQHLAHLGDFGASRDTVKDARDSAQRLHLRETLMELAVLDAEIAGHNGSVEQAAGELESVLLQSEANEFAFLSIRARVSLGRAYWRLGRTGEALDVLRKTAVAASTTHTLPLLAAAEIALGEVLLVDGDLGDASERAKRGLDAAESCGARPLVRQAAAILGEACAGLRRDQEATTLFTKARQLHLALVSRVPPSSLRTYLQHPDVVEILGKFDRFQRRAVG